MRERPIIHEWALGKPLGRGLRGDVFLSQNPSDSKQVPLSLSPSLPLFCSSFSPPSVSLFLPLPLSLPPLSLSLYPMDGRIFLIFFSVCCESGRLTTSAQVLKRFRSDSGVTEREYDEGDWGDGKVASQEHCAVGELLLGRPEVVHLHGVCGGERFAAVYSGRWDVRRRRKEHILPTLRSRRFLSLPKCISLSFPPSQWKSFRSYFNPQVIHGDLKPENILVRTRDNRIKLIDFGFSHIVTEELPSEVDLYARYFIDVSHLDHRITGHWRNGTLRTPLWLWDVLWLRRLGMWSDFIRNADAQSSISGRGLNVEKTFDSQYSFEYYWR